jgi:DNA modification methylase
MSLAFTEHDVAVWQGDALEQLTHMPAGSVQCAVTSPPYFGLRDYGTGRWEGGAEDCYHRKKNPEVDARTSTLGPKREGLSVENAAYQHGKAFRDVCGRCGAHRVDEQLGLESSPAEYVARMVAVFAELRRVLAADGVLWLNLGDSYASQGGKTGVGPNALVGSTLRQAESRTRPAFGELGPKNVLGMPWRVAFALQDDGWTLRNAVVWHKPNAMPESVTDRLSTRYELVFLFSRSRRYWFDLDAIKEPLISSDAEYARAAASVRANHRFGSVGGTPLRAHSFESVPTAKNPGDVWTVPTSPFPGAHFACMPPALAERCIKAGCPPGGTVLDPFAGSGTTLAAARKLGRKSVGIELNPDYIDLIRARIGQAPLEFDDAAAPIIGLEPSAVQDGFDFREAAL